MFIIKENKLAIITLAFSLPCTGNTILCNSIYNAAPIIRNKTSLQNQWTLNSGEKS